MINAKIRRALEAVFSRAKRKKIGKELLFSAAREHALSQLED